MYFGGISCRLNRVTEVTCIVISQFTEIVVLNGNVQITVSHHCCGEGVPHSIIEVFFYMLTGCSVQTFLRQYCISLSNICIVA